MDANNNAGKPAVEAWQAERLRLTVFPTDRLSEGDWWAQLTGEDPEKKISLPRVGGFREEGAYGGGMLNLQAKLDRVDLLFNAVVPEEAETLPMLGPYLDTLDIFLKLTSRWFEQDACPVAKRLAFGAVLLQPVDDRVSGYKQLAKYLSEDVKLDAENSRDFMYQINKPTRATQRGDFLVNRLSKWSVAFSIPATLNVSPESIAYLKGPSEFACLLELDINTSTETPTEFTPEDQEGVFTELVQFAKGIAEYGMRSNG